MKNRRYPTKIMLLIRAAVGAYLLYLSYGLYTDRNEGSMSQATLAVILAIFTVCGIGLIAHSAYLFVKGMYDGGPADVEVEEEEKDPAEALDEKIPGTEGAIDGEFREVEKLPDEKLPEEKLPDETDR